MEPNDQTPEAIYAVLRQALIELFEIEPEKVTPAANLYTDLEIDSIDAIDLIDHIRQVTGCKLNPNDFRSARTVQDVIDAMLKRPTSAS